MTIKEKAENLLSKREIKTREDGTNYIVYNNTTDEELDALMTAHLDRMPNDDSYTVIDDILRVIAECENENEIYDQLYNIEPDIYTYDLVSWLSHDNRNVSYIDDVLSEYGGNLTGFQLLSMAQYRFIIETGESLISALAEE